MTGPRMTLRCAAATHPGLTRPVNEDAVLAAHPVFLVADGMGGHADGELASRAVVSAFRELVGKTWVTGKEIAAAVQRAADRVECLGSGDGAPGSTLAGAASARRAGIACWLLFNIGDSRIYLMRSGQLRRISVDHSTRASSAGPRTRGGLIRAFGAGLERPVADQWLTPAHAGDRILVCSDGLSDEVAGEYVERVLRERNEPQEVVRRLVGKALAEGGRDNISAIVVDCLETVVAEIDELDDVVSLDEGEEETVSWIHEDTIPDPEGN